MAVTQIFVPINSSNEAKRNFIKEVSSILAGGTDVQFIDENSVPVNVPFIGLMAGTDGKIQCKAVEGDSVNLSLAASGFHQVWINKIFATGTDVSLGIHVKLV